LLRVVGLAEPILVLGLSRIGMLAWYPTRRRFVMQAVLVSPASAESYPLGGDAEAQVERLESLEKFRELLLRYEQSFASMKKISAKRLRNDYVGSVAEIGAELSTALQAAGLLPYRKGETLRLVEAEITAARKLSKRTLPIRGPGRQLQSFRHLARPQRPRREGITTYSDWAEIFAELASNVPCGETRVFGGTHHSRSPDGGCIETRYATTGKWRILKQTVTESDAATVKVLEARFSKYFSDGSIGESWEKETTMRFKQTVGETVRHPTDTAPLSHMAPRIEPRLDKFAWHDFLRQFVHVNPDTMRFTIGKREYQIDQFRFREMAKRGPIVNCLGMRGQVAEPRLSKLAEKLAYLHRSKKNASFESIIEDSLPWLIGNVDYFTDDETESTMPSRTLFNRATLHVAPRAD